MVKDRPALALIRNLAGHRWLLLLTMTGIALGVAVVVAVDLASQSVRQSFETSLAAVSGKATHRIIAGARGLDEQFYVDLIRSADFGAAAPVVEGYVRSGSQSLALLGLDPFAEGPFRPSFGRPGTVPVQALLTRPGAVLASTELAARQGWSVGTSFRVVSRGRERTLTLAGFLPAESAGALPGYLVADISTVQEVLDRTGRLDRVDLVLEEGQVEPLTAKLVADYRLEAVATGDRLRKDLGRSFRTNLAAMSLLALLVGGFLIFNAMSFAVVQRRSLMAVLRMVGVSRGQLFARIVIEALVIGAIGTLLGIAAGAWLASGLIDLVSGTMNDLYYGVYSADLVVSGSLLAKGMALGIGMTLLAALAPALDAARTPPVPAMRHSAPGYGIHRGSRFALLAAVLVSGAGALALAASGRSLGLGFVGLFGLIIGGCLAVPWLVGITARRLAPLAGRVFGLAGRYASRGIYLGLGRTGLAVATLTLAIATTIGMGTMVHSFRGSVEQWLNRSLQSDLYVSIPHSAGRNTDIALPAALGPAIERLGGVSALSSGRRVEVLSQYGPVELLAMEMAPRSYDSFRFIGAASGDLWSAFHDHRRVLVSESFAWRHELQAEEELVLHTRQGPEIFQVGGIFSDYGSDQGVVVMDRTRYATLWQDEGVSTLGIYLDEAASDTGTLGTIRALAAGFDPRIRVRPNHEIRDWSLNVFDRTFTITRVLRWLVLAVAFVGILAALMALQFERARENALLRASGFTRSGIVSLAVIQTGIMGAIAGVLAMPLGWVIGWVLTHVINRRSFGWQIDFSLAPQVYLEALVLAIVTATLAGLWPGVRMANTAPARALREE